MSMEEGAVEEAKHEVIVTGENHCSPSLPPLRPSIPPPPLSVLWFSSKMTLNVPCVIGKSAFYQIQNIQILN